MKLKDLRLISWNPRTISQSARAALSNSLEELGKYRVNPDGSDLLEDTKVVPLAETIAVNVNNNRILGGSQRVKILREAGYEEIPDSDILWFSAVPDSADEKMIVLQLNSPMTKGEYTPEAKDLLQEIREDLPEKFFALGQDALDSLIEKSKGVLQDMFDESILSDPGESNSSSKDKLSSGEDPLLRIILEFTPEKLAEYSEIMEGMLGPLSSREDQGFLVLEALKSYTQ